MTLNFIYAPSHLHDSAPVTDADTARYEAIVEDIAKTYGYDSVEFVRMECGYTAPAPMDGQEEDVKEIGEAAFDLYCN